VKVLHIILLSVLLQMAAFGAPAITREIVFTQPDGTHFSGKLKGDGSFHWIESNGDIIIYNPKDRYYYKAIVDTQKGLLISDEKALSVRSNERGLIFLKSKPKKVSKEIQSTLHSLYKRAKDSDGPR